MVHSPQTEWVHWTEMNLSFNDMDIWETIIMGFITSFRRGFGIWPFIIFPA
jgi:hypothetical protein